MFGLAPALQAPAIAVHDALKDSQPRLEPTARRHAWIRGALVVSEIAFACVLLVAAGLLDPELPARARCQPGIPARRELPPCASIRARGSSTQAQQNAYFDEALRRVKAMPGIEAAGLTDALPLGHNRSWGAAAKGQVYTRGNYPRHSSASSATVIRGHGNSLRCRPRIHRTGYPASEPVIIINQTLARRLWPGQDADWTDGDSG